MKTAVLIVAAGRGQRFGGEIPKQYCDFAGKMVLSHTADLFLHHDGIDVIQTVIHQDDQNLYDQAIKENDKMLPPVGGGPSRQNSVFLGLQSLKDHEPDVVLIHDAARPFATHDLVTALLAEIKSTNAVIPAVQVVDTLKKTDDQNNIVETTDRQNLWRAQTPQAFDFKTILDLHEQFQDQKLTDDASLFEAANLTVKIIEGHEDNFKITTQDDLRKAEKMLNGSLPDIRTGYGFDVHAFENGDHVTLGGLEIPHTQKLKGHSDADVALHALTDAILGSISAGDIGTHFPPSDEKWAGASSDRFLSYACDLVREKNGRINNLDLTIICEAPKIGPHRDTMTARIAEICGMDQNRISVKATTTEKLGFTGRKEGIAAQAVATITILP